MVLMATPRRNLASPFDLSPRLAPRCFPHRADSDRVPAVAWTEQLALGCVAGLLAVGTQVFPAQASLTDTLTPENALFDSAKIIPTSKRQQTNDALLQFEKETGYRIRLLSAYQGELDLTDDDIRDAWQPDSKTVIMAFDPSSPNIVAFRFIGDAVQTKLRRPFWVELQSRFGNMFFVRQEGEAAAVDGILKSVQQCLVKEEGCKVVPGLSSDQFFATLIVSLAGGAVLGFSSKLEQGAFYQRLGWMIVFSPLWLILFVNLGLGPIISRTADRWPIALNSGTFLGVALVFQFIDFPPKWMKGDISLQNKESQEDNNNL